ncbi:restriction endonuclease [Pseudoxanthomonas sp.]|uniref:restriction endonuclease n=1 Tax=Pseudoxanthomonas sp. TaxID=1871049 RepID=UPI002619E869|nr:restriction endonuclease [Pseudoxanthomonas sp.]WDS37209.1 MAG: restriction endonuclease [Pseudoxanthomonas sp.]
MQYVTSHSRRHAGAGGMPAIGADRLAAAYRARQFQVQVLALPALERANRPDVVLLLQQGREQVLVHAYARAQGAVSQGAVRQLAIDVFEAGAVRGVLIGAAGFMVSAYQAALHHAQLELVDERGLDALLESGASVSRPAPVRPPARSLREATRPPWPLRAAIGTGGMAMAVTMLFASIPALQGQLFDVLRPARPADTAFTQASANAWRAAALPSRVSVLDRQASVESASPARPAAFDTSAGLPANFNQALAPRL